MLLYICQTLSSYLRHWGNTVHNKDRCYMSQCNTLVTEKTDWLTITEIKSIYENIRKFWSLH